MRRVVLALFSTVTGLTILLGYKTHTVTTAAGAVSTSTTNTGSASSSGDTGAGSSSGSSSGSSGSSSGTSSTPTAGSSSSSSTTTTKTYTGSAASTRYGPVQVQITVTNGKVTAADAVVYPENDPRDEQINSYAVPQLNSEAVSAQSSKIDTVSGATYTSDGYVQSLQSALDQAGL